MKGLSGLLKYYKDAIKIIGLLLAFSTVTLFISGFTLIDLLPGERVDFQTIEALGGIKIGIPYQHQNVWMLPVECDAIGKFISQKPTAINSAPLAFYKAVVRIENHAIYFYLKRKLDQEYDKHRIQELKLGNLHPGTYKLYYINRDGTRVFIRDINTDG
jgi:hypothetical protein